MDDQLFGKVVRDQVDAVQQERFQLSHVGKLVAPRLPPGWINGRSLFVAVSRNLAVRAERPISSNASSAKPGGSIRRWHLLHVTTSRCFANCSPIVVAPRISGSIQTTLLALPPQSKGKPFLHEKRIRPIIALLKGTEQRKVWQLILATKKAIGARED
jgi:hypothetical protein